MINTGTPTVRDFIIDRIIGPTEKSQDTVRYYFQVDMGLNLYITQQGDGDTDYREATLRTGLEALARKMIRRGNEILEGVK